MQPFPRHCSSVLNCRGKISNETKVVCVPHEPVLLREARSIGCRHVRNVVLLICFTYNIALLSSFGITFSFIDSDPPSFCKSINIQIKDDLSIFLNLNSLDNRQISIKVITKVHDTIIVLEDIGKWNCSPLFVSGLIVVAFINRKQ